MWAFLTFIIGLFHELVPPEVSTFLPEVFDELVKFGLGDRAVVASNPRSVTYHDVRLHLKMKKKYLETNGMTFYTEINQITRQSYKKRLRLEFVAWYLYVTCVIKK